MSNFAGMKCVFGDGRVVALGQDEAGTFLVRFELPTSMTTDELEQYRAGVCSFEDGKLSTIVHISPEALDAFVRLACEIALRPNKERK